MVWEGCRGSRRCSGDTYPESYITQVDQYAKNTSKSAMHWFLSSLLESGRTSSVVLMTLNPCVRYQLVAGKLNQLVSGESAPSFHLLVRINFIIVVIMCTGLAIREFEFTFPGSHTSTFQDSARSGRPSLHHRSPSDQEVGNKEVSLWQGSRVMAFLKQRAGRWSLRGYRPKARQVPL